MTNDHSDKRTGAEPAAEAALLNGRAAFLGFLTKRLGNRADAEDVLQEFCVRVLARRDQLREVERMDAWLYAVLRSALTDHYRRTARRGRLTEAVASEPETWAEDAADQMAHICTCMTGLIPALRPADAELIRRIDFGEEDRLAVAADLGLSRNALGVRLHRARAALRDALMSHCGPCCKTGADDCYCPPAGCENPDHGSHCHEHEHAA
ncbi:MAG: sigma-70 family RNA polymerase sigma factor [Rhodobacteraceae bacterium]|nr:sigma-70 family RNA polymerase sigma factor [Paracoccaceae bacterium]